MFDLDENEFHEKVLKFKKDYPNNKDIKWLQSSLKLEI